MSTRSAKTASRRRGPSTLCLLRIHGVLLLALSLVGVAISLYLTYVHYRLHLEPNWQSSCSISESVDCDVVVSSPYGSFAGVPLSAIASWFYTLTALLSFAGLQTRRHFPRSPALILFVAASFAVALSFALAIVSAVAIGAFCILCMALYLVNLAMLAVTWRAVQATGETLRQAGSAERKYWKTRPVAATWSSLGVVTIPLLLVVLYPRLSLSDLCATLGRGVTTLVIYSDFQCPHCRTLDRSLRPFRHSANLRIVTRQFPLDASCNPQVPRTIHVGACLQARAALCAAAQGPYDEFSDRVYDDRLIEQSSLVGAAVALRLDRQAFESCLRSEDTTAQLARDIAAGNAANVSGTPAIFVNGRRHRGPLTSVDLRCLSDALSSTSTDQPAAARLTAATNLCVFAPTCARTGRGPRRA